MSYRIFYVFYFRIDTNFTIFSNNLLELAVDFIKFECNTFLWLHINIYSNSDNTSGESTIPLQVGYRSNVFLSDPVLQRDSRLFHP